MSDPIKKPKKPTPITITVDREPILLLLQLDPDEDLTSALKNLNSTAIQMEKDSTIAKENK